MLCIDMEQQMKTIPDSGLRSAINGQQLNLVPFQQTQWQLHYYYYFFTVIHRGVMLGDQYNHLWGRR